jgi:hypothetical protein
MANAAQLSFSFDLSPCGPVVDAATRRAMLAGIVDKVDADADMGLFGGDDGEDFGGEDDGAGDDWSDDDFADAAE